MNTKEVLNQQEAAACVGLSVDTFKKFCVKYGVEALTVGRKKLYRWADLLAAWDKGDTGARTF